MNKAQLAERQRMLSAVPTDQTDDFEDIILTPTAPGIEIKQRLREMIMCAITDGYNVFISGMARGVDYEK